MFPWKGIIVIVLVFCAIFFVLIIEWRIQDGKLKRVNTYSYMPVIKRSIIHFAIGFVICLLFYLYSKSLEVTVTIGAFLFFANIGGLIFGLLFSYQTKRRGGQKLN